MKKFFKIPLLFILTFYIAETQPCSAQSGNLLINSEFAFHSFINHREGKPVSYSSANVAYWNTDSWGDIEVFRESHVSENIRPDFSTQNLVAIKPGKKFWQFFTLPEAGLAHGEHINLSVYCFQSSANNLKAKIKIMKLDSESGEWSPKDYGFADKREFPKHSRGELVVAKEYFAMSRETGTVQLKILDAEIIGKFTKGEKSNSSDINTIGIQAEFENTSEQDTVWIYSPRLTKNENTPISVSRQMIPYYTNIPRTIQKLWKGEPVHIIVMGSSIDRGSANPPMYLYDEDPSSDKFKEPLSERIFDANLVNRPDLDGYYGWWSHYFSYFGRLKLELMRKFNLSADKICMNVMARDGSCVGEAHSGLREYCSLSIPPNPDGNGHKAGKTWQELYPELFSRKDGPRPDLIIFGSGANEKTDTPDEVAVFEGTIRWIQHNYPNTEFLFCMWQNFGEYTPNPGDLQALALRYQIPFIDFGKTNDQLFRWCNRYTLVPIDGHPQAAGHYIWFKQIEKAFECWDPIMTGQAQLQLPERLHPNSYNWEGEIITYDKTSNRIIGNKFIFDDNAINCWGKVDDEPPLAFVDGINLPVRRSQPNRDIRNSMFRYGRCSLGDRHILEIRGTNPVINSVDCKICPGRQFYPMDNPNWRITGIKVETFRSEWGAPYGSKKIKLQPGKSIEIDVLCTDLSVAYVDKPDAGIIEVFINDSLKLSQPANIPFIDTDEKENYLENRKGVLDLGFGLHTVKIIAKDKPVEILGIFTYDSRSNRDAERQLFGKAVGGEVIEFTQPFKSRPIVICTGKLKVNKDNITKKNVRFDGGNGYYQIIGE